MNKKSLLFTLLLGSVITISFVISSDNPQPKKSWWQFWKKTTQKPVEPKLYPVERANLREYFINPKSLDTSKTVSRFSFTNWLNTPVSQLWSKSKAMRYTSLGLIGSGYSLVVASLIGSYKQHQIRAPERRAMQIIHEMRLEDQQKQLNKAARKFTEEEMRKIQKPIVARD